MRCLDVVLEAAARLEDAGVLGKQAKQQPHQQHFQLVPGVAVVLERIVQPAHALGGLDVDRVLLLEGAALVAGDEAEQAQVAVQVLERELLLRARLQVVQAEALEVRHQDVARQVAVLEPGEVVAGLAVGAVQVPAPRLVLDQQDALPQQVDEAARTRPRA